MGTATRSSETVTEQGTVPDPSPEVNQTLRCDHDVLHSEKGILLAPHGQRRVSNSTGVSIVFCDTGHDCTLSEGHEAIPADEPM